MALTRYRFDYSNHKYFENIYYFFESFKDYINQIDNLVTDEIALSTKKFEQFEKEVELNPTWSDELFDYHYELRQKILLRNIYYDSLILTIYSFIEKQMFFVCHMLEKEQTIKVKDIAGKGVFKYRTYLTKVIKIDFEEINQEWDTLLKFNKLRNFLVHSEGFRLFPKSNTDLKNCLASFTSIELKEYEAEIGFTFLDNNILKDFCNIGEKIINHIFTQE